MRESVTDKDSRSRLLSEIALDPTHVAMQFVAHHESVENSLFGLKCWNFYARSEWKLRIGQSFFFNLNAEMGTNAHGERKLSMGHSPSVEFLRCT
jgi:hypothetical protein